jgi:hypothetical protein
MGLVHTNQPLSPVEAFALALVEASSRLPSSTAVDLDAAALPTIRDDDAVPPAVDQ